MSGSPSPVDGLQASSSQAYLAIHSLPLMSASLVCVGDSRPRRCVCVPTAGSSHSWHVQRLGRGLGVAVVMGRGCDCARSMCSLIGENVSCGSSV